MSSKRDLNIPTVSGAKEDLKAEGENLILEMPFGSRNMTGYLKTLREETMTGGPRTTLSPWRSHRNGSQQVWVPVLVLSFLSHVILGKLSLVSSGENPDIAHSFGIL